MWATLVLNGLSKTELGTLQISHVSHNKLANNAT